MRKPLITRASATDKYIISSLRRKGWTDDRISSYLRGWDNVKNSKGENNKCKTKKKTK